VTAESVWLDAGELRLHARVIGRGPAVVLLHGFTGSAESMASVADALSARFRTISIDLVGHGMSDAPRTPEAYRMASCVAQLARVIDALGIDQAHWLGYSMGARVALSFATVHSTRVCSLILIGARAGIRDPLERARRIESDAALAESIEREGLETFVDRWMAQTLFASQARLGRATLAKQRTQRLRNRAHGLALSLHGMGAGAQPPLFEHLPRMKRPTLLVVGEKDEKFSAIADELAQSLPRARVSRIGEAGHAAHLENPKAFVASVRRFLEEEE
jgi:2-succinyl-6-hydroxy-2,4-cyclohexadiene-1-carboxylate synthase